MVNKCLVVPMASVVVAKAKLLSVIFLVLCSISSIASAELQLKLLDSAHATNIVFSNLLSKFNQSHDSDLGLDQEWLKPEYAYSFAQPDSVADALSGRVGYDFRELASSKGLIPLNRTWRLNRFDSVYPPHLVEAVVIRGKKYGIPYSLHPWGLFYRKSAFSKLGLPVPDSWSQFLIHCELLKSSGITPVVIGVKEPEGLTTWFSFLNLRLNGAAFHRSLLEGSAPMDDPRVVLALEKWQLLLNRGYVKLEHGQFDWKGALASLYQNEAAIVLTGRVDHNLLSTPVYKDFGFMPFPSLTSSTTFDEIVQIDALAIPVDAEDELLALELAAFVGSAQTQKEIARSTGALAARKDVKTRFGSPAKSMLERVGKARELVPLLGDAIHNKHVGEIHQILKQFVENPNVEETIKSLVSFQKLLKESG